MKIKLPRTTKSGIGGGLTFADNFEKAIKPFGHTFETGDDYDILFIAGATLVEREDVIKAKSQGKKIVLRVDNILEDSKNKGTGMPRMRDFAELADVIVFQSEWAKKLLEPICGKGVVIYNGVDTDIFFPRTEPKNWDGIRIFYSKYSRNETKQVHEMQYWWREYNLEKRGDTMVIVGRFADAYTQVNNPFEFHNEEEFEYKGVIEGRKALADIIRSCDVALIPYLFDACPNAVLECQACGIPIIHSKTGGTPELVDFGCAIDYKFTPLDMVKLALKYKEDFKYYKHAWTLETMGARYDALFKTIFSEEKEV